MQSVTPNTVKAMLVDGEELAIIDLCEELIFSRGHLLFAPRGGTRILLCDDDDDLVPRAAAILERAGYTNLFALEGGVSAWGDRGRARLACQSSLPRRARNCVW